MADHKSEIINLPSPLSPLPSPLFSVRTPTAVVTDLGTEFGVEVDRSGVSRAHVFQGAVQLRRIGADGKEDTRVIPLAADQSATVEAGRSRRVKVIRNAEPAIASAFVRQMPRRMRNAAGQIGDPSRRPPSYRLIDLGTLGGATSSAIGINAGGQVVGHAATAAGAIHAFLYDAGRMKDLGTLHGGNSYGVGINVGGQIVGCSGDKDDSRAFLYSGGKMKDLGTLGGRSSSAQAINAAGQVVGASRNSRGVNHAFLYSDGTMKDLGPLGGVDSYARGITSTGLITGYVGSGKGGGLSAPQAFLYSGSGVKNLSLLGGNSSCAWGINEAGQVVGFRSDANGVVRAFLYSQSAGTKDLGTLGGQDAFAAAINSAGQVVGWAAIASGECHAFLYTAGTMIDLNSAIEAGARLDPRQRHGHQ